MKEHSVGSVHFRHLGFVIPSSLGISSFVIDLGFLSPFFSTHHLCPSCPDSPIRRLLEFVGSSPTFVGLSIRRRLARAPPAAYHTPSDTIHAPGGGDSSMGLGPIVNIELVTNARRVRYFVLKVVYAALLWFILWSTHAAVSGYADGGLSIQQAAAMARHFFVSFSSLQIVAILLVGPALVAGTIATERERRTIEYLFATDLSNSEIVLGKLFARLLLLAYLVAVGLPILAIFGLLGGIHYQLVAFTFVVSASTMVMLASLATCISVWSPRARDAITRVYLILLVLVVLPIPVQDWLSAYGGMVAVRTVTEAILTINPIWTLLMELAPVGRGAGIAWRTLFILVAGQLTIAVASMVLATVAVRSVHLRSSGKRVRSQGRSRAFRRPAIGNRPMLWKEAFARQAGAKLGVMGRLAAAILIVAILVGMGLCTGSA